MKILMIHDYFPNEAHGIYTHTHHLSKELIKRYEVEQLNVITPVTCVFDGRKVKIQTFLYQTTFTSLNR